MTAAKSNHFLVDISAQVLEEAIDIIVIAFEYLQWTHPNTDLYYLTLTHTYHHVIRHVCLDISDTTLDSRAAMGMLLRSRVPARRRDHHLGVRLWPALRPSLQHARTGRDRVISHAALVAKRFQRPLGADEQCLVCISKNIVDMVLVCSCLQHPSVRAVAVFVVTTKRRVKDERRATYGKRTNYLWKVAIKADQLPNCTKGR